MSLGRQRQVSGSNAWVAPSNSGRGAILTAIPLRLVPAVAEQVESQHTTSPSIRQDRTLR
jgi:hypothetical protein